MPYYFVSQLKYELTSEGSFMNKTQTCALALVVAVAVALAGGCGGADQEAQQRVAENAAWEAQTAGEGPARRPVEPPAEPATGAAGSPDELGAAHILIMHKDSERVPPEVTRTKEEALALVEEIAKKLEGEGADFAALAKEYSDCPSAAEGGDLGNFAPGRMAKPFSEATMKLAIGEISDPVETQFGYHLIRRQPTELIAAHILIMHKQSERVPPEVTRTKEEALALVEEIAKKLEAEGADFAALAKQHSDCPSAAEGGDLGNFAPGRMAKPFSEATMKLAIGETSDPVETQFGYHLIRRQETRASAKHILVQYRGSTGADAGITRTKEEAQARIEEFLRRVKEGEKFEDLAKEGSDCPSGQKGGDLGEFPRGKMDPLFQEAAFACEVGKITDVVETPFGYHIIYRYK